MSKSYGGWSKPTFGTLHFRPAPGITPSIENMLPREGPGDYRRPAANHSGGEGRKREGARYHNPVPVIVPAGHRSQIDKREYVPRRNGLPDSSVAAWTVEDNWRRPGWEARAARNGLDLAAIAAADRELRGTCT